jgi:hypothetical protein
MTPAGHYERAQLLLGRAKPAGTREVLAAALIHATLALAPLVVAEAAEMHTEWA